jgi:hypothetical protein
MPCMPGSSARDAAIRPGACSGDGVDAGLHRFITEQAVSLETGLVVWVVTRAVEKHLEFRRKGKPCSKEKTSSTTESSAGTP